MKRVLGFGIIAAVAALAIAQDTAPKAKVTLDKTSVKVGTVVKGKVTINFEPGLHGYQNPPSEEYQIPVKLVAEKGTTLVKATYPKGVPFLMAGETKPSMVYEDKVEIPIEIKAPAKAGKTTVKLVLTYQQCNENSCFPPGKLVISVPLTVTAK